MNLDLLSNNMRNGTLVSIEGIDGAGKTTVIQGDENVDGLNNIFSNATYTREPNNDTWLGQVVRKAISNSGPDTPPMSVFFLFLAEHANHLNDIVRPSLDNGELVICDRYIDSRYAYQSYEIRDLIDINALEWIRHIQEQEWTEIPDKTIILDLPVDVAIERLDGDEIFEKKEKLKHFRQTYLNLADLDDRYSVVDAQQSPQEVLNKCKHIIENAKDDY
jgi:dTMP kinase